MKSDAYMDFFKTRGGVKIHRHFNKIEDEMENSIEHLIRGFQKYMHKFPDSTFDYLDIGAGDGEKTTDVLTHLETLLGQEVSLDFLEPSHLENERFLLSAKENVMICFLMTHD